MPELIYRVSEAFGRIGIERRTKSIIVLMVFCPLVFLFSVSFDRCLNMTEYLEELLLPHTTYGRSKQSDQPPQTSLSMS